VGGFECKKKLRLEGLNAKNWFIIRSTISGLDFMGAQELFSSLTMFNHVALALAVQIFFNWQLVARHGSSSKLSFILLNECKTMLV
jgi:hypothetical protein